VLWNLDTLDWKTQNKDKIVRHVMSHVEDGSVILLHDVYDTSVEAALEIVDRLLEEGYNFVTVDEMIID
jgi:peptidoglycan/xylan/chitin deacetylase (PgdA/CDA1 family)